MYEYVRITYKMLGQLFRYFYMEQPWSVYFSSQLIALQKFVCIIPFSVRPNPQSVE